jgi:hypothetical protein
VIVETGIAAGQGGLPWSELTRTMATPRQEMSCKELVELLTDYLEGLFLRMIG